MSLKPSSGANGAKSYFAHEFRGSFPESTSYSGEVRRHKFDCQLAAAAAKYSTGPRYCDDTIRAYARTIASPDNVHYYGSSSSNMGHDLTAAKKVLKSAHTGERAVLSAHEASHIREGAAWLAKHKHEFSQGFINSAAALYANVYYENGRKVVDQRTLRY